MQLSLTNEQYSLFIELLKEAFFQTDILISPMPVIVEQRVLTDQQVRLAAHLLIEIEMRKELGPAELIISIDSILMLHASEYSSLEQLMPDLYQLEEHLGLFSIEGKASIILNQNINTLQIYSAPSLDESYRQYLSEPIPQVENALSSLHVVSKKEDIFPQLQVVPNDAVLQSNLPQPILRTGNGLIKMEDITPAFTWVKEEQYVPNVEHDQDYSPTKKGKRKWVDKSSEKYQRRLENNRKSAQESRDRKKQLILDLEKQVKDLEQEQEKLTNALIPLEIENNILKSELVNEIKLVHDALAPTEVGREILKQVGLWTNFFSPGNANSGTPITSGQTERMTTQDDQDAQYFSPKLGNNREKS